MDIKFLAFSGCPLADPARENLKAALKACGIEDFEEIDILNEDASEEVRGWGSPTILVNGEDITGIPKGNSVSCRVYPFEGGVPDVSTIADGINSIWT